MGGLSGRELSFTSLEDPSERTLSLKRRQAADKQCVAHARAHARKHIHTHTHTHKHAQTQTQTQTHIRTHMHTDTHTSQTGLNPALKLTAEDRLQ